MGCWGEVEAALAELAELEQALGEVEAEQVERLARMEQELETGRGPLDERRRELTGALERFCRRQKPGLDRVDGHERRSRRLLFGRVGWRASQAVVIRDEATAMRTLAGWRPGRKFLRVRAELDREGLREFLARAQALNGSGAGIRRRLSRAGIRMEQREKWFYEIDWKAVKRWGGRKNA
ncbi:MAG: host-nuclease inhibitor Gam family protein [Candidatus Acidiferrales bacterium]